jgi:hypothetical protein
MHEKIDVIGGVLTIILEPGDGSQTVVGEFLREMALLAGIAGGTHFCCTDRILEVVQDSVHQKPQVSGFSEELHSEEVAPNVTIDARHARVWGDLISAEFWRHRMAGCPAELGRVGILPYRGNCEQDDNKHHSQTQKQHDHAANRVFR